MLEIKEHTDRNTINYHRYRTRLNTPILPGDLLGIQLKFQEYGLCTAFLPGSCWVNVKKNLKDSLRVWQNFASARDDCFL